MPSLGKMVVRVVVLSAFYIAQLAAFGWLAGRHGIATLQAFGLKRDPDAASEPGTSLLGSAGIVIALFVGCEVISIGYGLAMQAAGVLQPETLSSDLGGVFGSGPVGLASAVLLVAFAAPFAEEIAFRGIVLPALGNRWGMWPGIVGSAALYAAYHANLWLFAPTMVLGVALGWLTWTRRSLWPAVALHVLYNAAAVAAAFAMAR
jgi:membrane protease YdiL (CAAX protease family)